MSEAKPRKEQDPDAFMNAAREQLQKQREEVLTRRTAIDEELATIEGKLSRIEAYFSPPKATQEPKARKPRATGPRAPRTSGVRDKVLAEIQKHQDGIKAADLIEAMGGKDNKQVETSVRNAVSALKKENKITTNAGIYKAA